MEVIKAGIKNAEKIINKKNLSEDKTYRLSLHTYLYEEKGRYLIQNTMTKEVTELTAEEWAAISALKNNPQSYELIEQHGLRELAEKRYIVESEYDEVKQYQQTVFLLKTMAGQKKGLSSYTIFPTTGCNARCVYCYEEGYEIKTMTSETADRLVDFICETRHDDIIKLHWFGGEPLAAAHIIRRICTALRERGIEFRSSMVTNASLMTKELAHEAKTLWNLKKVQVSLDGAKEDYTPRKNYYAPEKHNYDVVMKAIHYLADEGIKVRLRVNVDSDNIQRIGGFLEDIKAEFNDMENITLYLAALFQEQQGEHFNELHKKILSFDKQIRSLKTARDLEKEHKIEFRLNYCMADSMDKSIVITPDGAFSNCEHLPDDHSWGNIFDGVTDQDLFDKLKKPVDIDEQCRNCPFLPICTPFYKKGCPGWFDKCYEFHSLRTENNLHNLIEGAEAESEDEEQI